MGGRAKGFWRKVATGMTALLATAGVLVTPAPAAASVPLSTAIYNYMATRSGVVTVCVYDAVSNHSWWWHITVRGYTASIVKADILAALMHRDGTLTPAQFSLAAKMIELSDNDAATELFQEIGGATGLDAFNDLAGLNMTAENWAWGLTTTSSWDQVLLLKRLMFRNTMLTDSQRAYELRLMANVTASQRWGVTGGVPAGVVVSLKNGWLPLTYAQGGGWQVNSIGYVHGLGRSYAIAVLTHSPTFDYGVATIRGVSSIVWPYMAVG